MSSSSRRLRRSASSASASRFDGASATVRSYSGPKPSCSVRVRRARSALHTTSATTTTAATAITIHAQVGTPVLLFGSGEAYPGRKNGKRRCTGVRSLLTSCAARRLTLLGLREQPASARLAGTSSRRCDARVPDQGVSLAAKPAASHCARARLRAGRSLARLDRDRAEQERDVRRSGKLARPSDRALSRRHVALATGHEPPPHARLDELPHRPRPPLPALDPRPLAGARGARAGEGAPSAVSQRLALHPPLRSVVARRWCALLRRPPDGRLVPAALRAAAVPAQGHRRPLDAARADLGGGPRAPQLARLQPVAAHGTALRGALDRPGPVRQLPLELCARSRKGSSVAGHLGVRGKCRIMRPHVPSPGRSPSTRITSGG